MHAGKVAAVITAVEKRFNFIAGDSEPRAHAFDYFLSLLARDDGMTATRPTQQLPATAQGSRPQLAATALDWQCIPQWLPYERGGDLELWLLRLCL